MCAEPSNLSEQLAEEMRGKHDPRVICYRSAQAVAGSCYRGESNAGQGVVEGTSACAGSCKHAGRLQRGVLQQACSALQVQGCSHLQALSQSINLRLAHRTCGLQGELETRLEIAASPQVCAQIAVPLFDNSMEQYLFDSGLCTAHAGSGQFCRT